ncbi:MAG: sodium/solute symporter [Elusimicrobia bacterium]|nr:sodium/solute symporter [Candidatus Obscuribacterium magneticum]
MSHWFSGPSNLSALDYLMVTGAVAVLFAIGYFAGRRQESTHDFFLGGRRIPRWAACLSFVATEISAVTIISVPATAYKENWEYLQFFIGSFASRFALAAFFIPAFYKFNCTTIYEYLKHRFGAETQVTATCFFFVTRLLGSGVRLTVAALAVSVLIGWDLKPTILLFSIIAIIYIAWGGIKAIVWTGVWQATTFIIGGVATIWFFSSVVPGGLVGIFKTAAEGGKLKVFDWGPSPFDPNFFTAARTEANIWWLAILNGFFGSMAAYGTDHELMQRLLTLETKKKSQQTTLATPLAGLGVLSLYLTIGAGLYAFYVHNPGLPLPQELDKIYPYFVNTQMPALLRGLILSVVIMASIDSPLGSLTASFVTDIYRPLLMKDRSDKHYLNVSRIMVVVFGIILAILAYSFSFLSGFLWWAFKIGGVTFGSLLGVFLLGFWTKRKSNRANTLGMIFWALVNVVLLILSEKNIFVVGWTWLVLLGTFGTFVTGYILGPILEKQKDEKAP